MKEDTNINYEQKVKDIIENNENNIKNKRKIKIKKVRKYIFIFLLLCVVIIIVFIRYKQVFQTKKTYTVINGRVEKISDSIGIFVKDETVVNTDKSKSIIPIVDQNTRVSKNGAIAMYKDDNYDSYIKKVGELDKDIETLVKDLPSTYSTEIVNINKNINIVLNEMKESNSYFKMQEYKNELDELSSKKVKTLSQNSPTGSKIRELIEKREKLEKESVKLSNNIKSPLAGAVSYKLDGLEEKIDESTLIKYGISQIDELFSKYSDNEKNEYGIKIIDNYNGYFIVKTPIEESKDYIKENMYYNIKTTEHDIYNFEAKLIKNISNDKYNYTIFKIENGIENIIDYRTIGLEVVWNKTEGLAVLNSAINRSADDKYNFVTKVYGGKYINIPIKVINLDNNISIVENYTNEEIENMGIKREAELSLYDILVTK